MEGTAGILVLQKQTRRTLLVCGLITVGLLVATVALIIFLVSRPPEFCKDISLPADASTRARAVEKRVERAGKKLLNRGSAEIAITQEDLNCLLAREFTRVRPGAKDARARIGDNVIEIAWTEKHFGVNAVARAKLHPSLTKSGDLRLDIANAGIGTFSAPSSLLGRFAKNGSIVVRPEDFSPVAVRFTQFECKRGMVKARLALKQGAPKTIRIHR